jgi:hypothetical protein
MSYIILRGHLLHIIFLNVHAPTEDKIDYRKESFYEELKRIFDNFPKYNMEILLVDFNAKVGFFNQQLGMKIYKRLLMIIELSTFFHI